MAETRDSEMLQAVIDMLHHKLAEQENGQIKFTEAEVISIFEIFPLVTEYIDDLEQQLIDAGTSPYRLDSTARTAVHLYEIQTQGGNEGIERADYVMKDGGRVIVLAPEHADEALLHENP